jgi:multidrug efflux pump subunit AcrA (membrane-fusion protein)
MKKYVSLALLATILTSCGAPAPVIPTEEPAKIPFSVKVKSYDRFPKEYTVQKTGRLVGSSSIGLTSQGVGRIDAVLVKEGASVKK